MDWRTRLIAYLRERLPSADAIEIAGLSGMGAGASNETLGIDLRVTADGYPHLLRLILRPQRRDGILAPYDIARQFQIMRALEPTPVPVPAVAWYESNPDILGAPFYLMERVRGDTLPIFWYGGQSPRLASVARALAAVHAVDWRRHLPFLAEGEPATTPLSTDLAPWRARARHMRIEHAPLLIALGQFLSSSEPADARSSFLHGDPNPGNYLLDGDRVAAVVDWEVAGIGDPRSDLGFYAALMTVFGGLPSHASRTLLSDAYERETGTPLRDLEYYEGVGLYKMAIVLSGWTGRTGFGYGLESITRRLADLFGPRWNAV
jgi:aminoglycoside phosphotransferase (APT) family kinase protein